MRERVSISQLVTIYQRSKLNVRLVLSGITLSPLNPSAKASKSGAKVTRTASTVRGKGSRDAIVLRRLNLTFRYMQSDMYNLFPAEGEINGLRKNFSMAMIPNGPLAFGSCQVKIQNRKIEPQTDIREDIARTYFYIDNAYPGHGIISNKNQKIFEMWDKEDPVDVWECHWVRKIEKLQRNRNDIRMEATSGIRARPLCCAESPSFLIN